MFKRLQGVLVAVGTGLLACAIHGQTIPLAAAAGTDKPAGASVNEVNRPTSQTSAADNRATRKTLSLRYLNDLGASSATQRRLALLWLAEHGLHQAAIQVAPLLRDEDDQNRELAEYAMWRMWGRSGDARIDRRFDAAVRQMGEGDLDGAIKAFSGLIRDRPDLAEAWNKRATAYFLLGRLEQSLADCHEVIRRNPVHFGVLSGYGQIHARQGNYLSAIEYFERALAINPNMPGVETNIRGLRILLEESRKNTT